MAEVTITITDEEEGLPSISLDYPDESEADEPSSALYIAGTIIEFLQRFYGYETPPVDSIEDDEHGLRADSLDGADEIRFSEEPAERSGD